MTKIGTIEFDILASNDKLKPSMDSATKIITDSINGVVKEGSKVDGIFSQLAADIERQSQSVNGVLESTRQKIMGVTSSTASGGADMQAAFANVASEINSAFAKIDTASGENESKIKQLESVS